MVKLSKASVGYKDSLPDYKNHCFHPIKKEKTITSFFIGDYPTTMLFQGQKTLPSNAILGGTTIGEKDMGVFHFLPPLQNN